MRWIRRIVEEGAIPIMLNVLRASASTDPRLSIKVIEFLHNILYVGEPVADRDDMDLIGRFSGLRMDTRTKSSSFTTGATPRRAPSSAAENGDDYFLDQIRRKALSSANMYVIPIMEGGKSGSMEGLTILAAVLQAPIASYGGHETRDLTRTILRSWYSTDINGKGQFQVL